VTEILTRDSFDIVKKLGDGAYGVVYLVKKKDTG
jgi:serine/threonine protein kinase